MIEMKSVLVFAALLLSTCSASLYGAVSSQYQTLDPHSHTYSYGYADGNSQKHESRSHDGVTRGSYSYVDGHGLIQSVSYTADPHHGFKAVGTNLPQAPSALVHAAPLAHYGAPFAPLAPYAVGHAYAGYPQAHIALTHAGVPVDTPEVQHAKAAHAVAYATAAAAAAAAPAGHDGHGGHHLYKRSLYAGPWAYGGHAAPVALTHGGVPVDAPDVQAAKAEHFAAHAKVLGQLGHGLGHGAPHDTPEVAHAKAAHFAAHAAARAGHPGGAPHAFAGHGYHVPVIHNGVPVDTPEVQHAKAAHFAAVAEASARAGPSSHDDGSYLDGHWADGGHYGGGYKHSGPIHIPVIQNGVPVEPPEVQHARAAHLSALAAASHKAVAHGGYYGGHDDGHYYGHY